jgi:hypothetical protein
MSHQKSSRIKASVLLLPDVVMEYETLFTGSWRCVRKERVTLPFPRSTSTPNPVTTVVSVQIPIRINPEEKRIARVTSSACRAVSPLHHRFDETRLQFRRNSSRETVRTTGVLARLVFHVVCGIMVITRPTLGQGSIAVPSLSDVRQELVGIVIQLPPVPQLDHLLRCVQEVPHKSNVTIQGGPIHTSVRFEHF